MSIYEHITRMIGESFKNYRTNSKLSMRDIYKDEKISIATISDLENGKKLPRVETLITLLQKVGMPLDRVFNDKILPISSFGIVSVRASRDWKHEIRNDLIESKFLPNEIDEIIRYIDYIKANRFTDKK